MWRREEKGGGEIKEKNRFRGALDLGWELTMIIKRNKEEYA
jgi:hypothetical protein